MRELHGWHERGDHGRHARDAHAPADRHAARAQDGPRHATHDSPKLRMLLDPAARIAEQLRYRETVEGYSPKHAADQRKPANRDGDQDMHRVRGADRPRTGGKENDTAPEGRDEPASKIDGRTKELDGQRQDRRTPERSRLPRHDTAQMVGGYAIAFAALADAVNILPGKWDAVLTGFVGAAVGTVAWANRRWKEKHGHRPED